MLLDFIMIFTLVFGILYLSKKRFESYKFLVELGSGNSRPRVLPNSNKHSYDRHSYNKHHRRRNWISQKNL